MLGMPHCYGCLYYFLYYKNSTHSFLPLFRKLGIDTFGSNMILLYMKDIQLNSHHFLYFQLHLLLDLPDIFLFLHKYYMLHYEKHMFLFRVVINTAIKHTDNILNTTNPTIKLLFFFIKFTYLPLHLYKNLCINFIKKNHNCVIYCTIVI